MTAQSAVAASDVLAALEGKPFATVPESEAVLRSGPGACGGPGWPRHGCDGHPPLRRWRENGSMGTSAERMREWRAAGLEAPPG